jgi:DNA polymerase-1
MIIPNDDVCGQCPFASTRNERFVGPGDIKKAHIAVVGMNPGKTELELGEYFVGPAGKNLEVGLQLVGLKREDIYITNAVKCYTFPKKESIRANHIRYCREYLDWEIEQCDPDLIVVAGDVALQAVVGIKGVTTKIKKLLWSERYQKPVIAILHPAAVLHNPKNKRLYLESIQFIGRFLQGELQSSSDLGEYHVLTGKDEFDEIIKQVIEYRAFCFDIENNNIMPHDPDCQIRCIGFTYKPRYSVCLPWTEFAGSLKEYVLKVLHWILHNPDIAKVGHNVWFDLKHFDVRPQGTIWDTMLEHYLLNENASHGLKQLAWEHTQLGGYEKKIDSEGGPGIVPVGPELYRYNNIDVDITMRLHEKFKPQLIEQGLDKPYLNIIAPAAEVLADMEMRGVRLDIEYARALKDKAEELLPTYTMEMREFPVVKRFEKQEDTLFNPRSIIHVSDILYKYMQLPVLGKTKNDKPSTKSTVLEKLENRTENEFVGKLLDYRLVYGLYSKYLGKLEELCDANYRVHTTYLLHVARSGRTSSANPNLQNIPKRGQDVLDVKNCFVPSPGNYLLEADFNQHEYRVVAGVAPDALMLRLFKEDRRNYERVLSGEKSWQWYKDPIVGVALDMHRANASEVFNVSYAEVTSEQRRDAKSLSFGVLYGMGAFHLSQVLKCSQYMAQKYLNDYFEKFRGIKEWKDRETQNIIELGYVVSCTGRRRRFHYSDHDAIREGINTLIQGPASDFMLLALASSVREFKRQCIKSQILMQVHDSIVIDLVPEELDTVVKILRWAMESASEGYIDVPLQADFSIGERWGALTDLWKWQEDD